MAEANISTVPEGQRAPGHALAMGAAVLITADTILIAGVGIGSLLAWSKGAEAASVVKDTPLPIGIYLAWALGVFGTVTAIVSIALYRYCARWFWRCLLVASVVWLAFPPIHAVIGLLSLILLIRFRSAFPK
jgi:hypothetical protein